MECTNKLYFLQNIRFAIFQNIELTSKKKYSAQVQRILTIHYIFSNLLVHLAIWSEYSEKLLINKFKLIHISYTLYRHSNSNRNSTTQSKPQLHIQLLCIY